MGHLTSPSSTAAAAAGAVLLAMITSTGALGACKTTLRGELVQAPTRPAFPGKFLFFAVVEMTPASSTGSEKLFRYFVVPNTRTTLPIPFALDIDSPGDCPSELELRVSTRDTDQATFRWGDEPLTGWQAIHLDKFESIRVWGPNF
jgi:hypothetical protein